MPQHYVRQFRIPGTKQVVVATVQPYRYIGPAAINRQCYEDYFYGADGALDTVLQHSENEIAPVLLRVVKTRTFDEKELVALRFLAAVLHARTRKMVDAAKVFPKHIADEVIKHAIERGELPPPEGGWRPGMMDFKGVPGFLIANSVIPCWLEMQTLACKILETNPTVPFFTSDNPVVLMNQLFADAERHRSFVGFSRSGFQLVLPISAELCLFFYDPKVYKVGSRRSRLVAISKEDCDLINSLQIQSADRCLYFHDPSVEPGISRLVLHNGHLRRPVTDILREMPGTNPNETLIHVRKPSVKLPNPWTFCRQLRHVHVGPDRRRKPAWTALVTAVAKDMHEHPNEGNVFDRIEKILGCSIRDPSPSQIGL